MIPTEVNSQIEYLVGDADIVVTIKKARGMAIFDDNTIFFLDRLYRRLMKDPDSKAYPDVVTFAFWCRKANITGMKKTYESEMNLRIGLGLTFHIAPSNVAVNFAYSATVALLAGDACVVRLPSKEFPQVDIICRAFREVTDTSINDPIESLNAAMFKDRVIFVRYPRSKECNDYFSDICDARIIWGGDNTINELRKSRLKPRAREIAFADRYSLAIIDADEYMRLENHRRIAEDFYNDTYLSDQNACTSPRFVIWIGGNVKNAKKAFWHELHEVLLKQYKIRGVQAVDKLTKTFKLGTAFENSVWDKTDDNLITRVSVDYLDSKMSEYYGNSGFFIEYDAKNLDEILPICTEKLQTVSCIGVDTVQILKFVEDSNCKGIDRIVPMGHTMDFALIWDGYDLIREMSRILTV